MALLFNRTIPEQSDIELMREFSGLEFELICFNEHEAMRRDGTIQELIHHVKKCVLRKSTNSIWCAHCHSVYTGRRSGWDILQNVKENQYLKELEPDLNTLIAFYQLAIALLDDIKTLEFYPDAWWEHRERMKMRWDEVMRLGKFIWWDDHVLRNMYDIAYEINHLCWLCEPGWWRKQINISTHEQEFRALKKKLLLVAQSVFLPIQSKFKKIIEEV